MHTNNEMKNNQTVDKVMVIPCEVYSRVTGYYRPVNAWNIGKQQEFKDRNKYDKAFATLEK